jgi:hypothetical protein
VGGSITSQLLKELQGLPGFLFIEDLNRKPGMDKDIIILFDPGSQLQTHLSQYSPNFHIGHETIDLSNSRRNRHAHGVLFLSSFTTADR